MERSRIPRHEWIAYRQGNSVDDKIKNLDSCKTCKKQSEKMATMAINAMGWDRMALSNARLYIRQKDEQKMEKESHPVNPIQTHAVNAS